MELTDPQAIRALAHPLRIGLVELLGGGPMTAAECARALGSTQANCSFHLRQLAKYGFVAEAPPGPDRRERRWQLLDYEQNWSAADNPELTRALDEVFIRREAGRLLDWTARRGTEPLEWRQAAIFGGATVPLTPEEVEDVQRRLGEIRDYMIAKYGDRIGDRATWPVGSRPVRLLMAITPLPDIYGALPPDPDAPETTLHSDS